MSDDQQRLTSVFPVPDTFALELSKKLQEKIRLTIVENGGSIGFDQYMEMALYEPGLGYYSAGASKFGEQGDFVTAPELSPIFSRCIATQCQQLLSEIPSACILELGPGTGAMAVEILRELELNRVLPSIYYMLEPSADLRQRQQQKVRQEIPHLEERIVWLKHLPQEKIDGIILANEVIDAMPVKRIVMDSQLEEYAVTCKVDVDDQIEFQWVKRKLRQNPDAEIHEILLALPTPYITEINFNIKPWLESLNDVLGKGLILISDYGYPRQEYFHPQRNTGTLICHYRHHAHDNPFLYPGLQDITASVDFTAVAAAAVDTGLHVTGFTTQAHFLIACGLDQFVSDYDEDNVIDKAQENHQVSKLTMPGEMGEKFKFIGLSKELDIQLNGFNFIDQRGRL